MKLIQNNITYNHCPLCESKDIKYEGKITCLKPLVFSTTTIQTETKSLLYKCNTCHSGFKQNIIPETIAMSLYASGNSNERWTPISFNESKLPEVVNALQKVFLNNAKVLDIGCNTGELLDMAKTRGSITYGNELSTESQKILLAKGHIVCNTITEIEDGSIDVITAFDLIEHIYNVSEFLALCKSKLKSKGRLVIFTGNVQSKSAQWAGNKWWYLKYPEHVIFPSVSFLESKGFTLEEKIDTYASVGYKRSFFKSLKALIKGKLTNTYKGLPSWGPDHYLVILCNK
jgi:2-polyprenyl-3-methyl-5-hydroxy-6-metoxy-1,4-benzoquinol methylase